MQQKCSMKYWTCKEIRSVPNVHKFSSVQSTKVLFGLVFVVTLGANSNTTSNASICCSLPLVVLAVGAHRAFASPFTIFELALSVPLVSCSPSRRHGSLQPCISNWAHHCFIHFHVEFSLWYWLWIYNRVQDVSVQNCFLDEPEGNFHCPATCSSLHLVFVDLLGPVS